MPESRPGNTRNPGPGSRNPDPESPGIPGPEAGIPGPEAGIPDPETGIPTGFLIPDSESASCISLNKPYRFLESAPPTPQSVDPK